MNRENYTKEECWKIADALAAERLPEINQKSESVQVNNTFYSKYIKRIMDILISGIALVVTSPINLFVLIGTFLDVGRPIIFKQERVGKKGKPFKIIKFRNMTNDTDENGELLPA